MRCVFYFDDLRSQNSTQLIIPYVQFSNRIISARCRKRVATNVSIDADVRLSQNANRNVRRHARHRSPAGVRRRRIAPRTIQSLCGCGVIPPLRDEAVPTAGPAYRAVSRFVV